MLMDGEFKWQNHTSKLQLVVPLMEYPHAWSSLPGSASPEIWRPSIAGNGSSSAAAYHNTSNGNVQQQYLTKNFLGEECLKLPTTLQSHPQKRKKKVLQELEVGKENMRCQDHPMYLSIEGFLIPN